MTRIEDGTTTNPKVVKRNLELAERNEAYVLETDKLADYHLSQAERQRAEARKHSK